MNLSSNAYSQFSLIPLFNDFGHPDADKYNQAFDIWNNSFGQYITLIRFKPSITSKSQTPVQSMALLNAVSNPEMLKKLLSIDTGFSCLNNQIKRSINGALLANADRDFSESRKKSNPLNDRKKEQEEKQLKRDSEILRLLELEEKLLEHESEFQTEAAAKKSTLIKQAQELPEIKPVITKKSIWFWNSAYKHDLMRFEQVVFDGNGKAKEGYFVDSWILTFEKTIAL